MYRIVWLTSKNPLGETRTRDESRIENVILWIMRNHESLTRLTAGYTVYRVSDDDTLDEAIWNWQHDAKKCFGRLFKDGFPHLLLMDVGELRVYKHVLPL